jgi:hypothetical protein
VKCNEETERGEIYEMDDAPGSHQQYHAYIISTASKQTYQPYMSQSQSQQQQQPLVAQLDAWKDRNVAYTRNPRPIAPKHPPGTPPFFSSGLYCDCDICWSVTL